MKKLLLISVVAILFGCSETHSVNPVTVIGIELNSNSAHPYKYQIRLSNENRYDEVLLYSDTLYSVGDTLIK